MRSYFIIWLAILLIATALSATAQKHPAHLQKSESIKVWGKCKCSKTDIEKAAREAGASFASYDIRANTLMVAYDLQKTNSTKIQQRIASAGYDTQQVVAGREAYEQLPDCCKYERRKIEKRNCCDDEWYKEVIKDNTL